MDLKPGNAVTIIECDMNVEFDAPEGYVEPNYAAALKPDEMVRLCPTKIALCEPR